MKSLLDIKPRTTRRAFRQHLFLCYPTEMNVILGNLGMKSARIVKPNVPLEVQELETPRPKGPQVLIKVESSGVCHSDIHLWEGGYEVLPSHPLQI